MQIGKYEYPEGLFYDRSHAYARLLEKEVVQGLTDLGQGLWGEVISVEFPSVGRQVRQGDLLFSVQPSEAPAMAVQATISGEVVVVNEDLKETPGAINSDPYGDGWVVKIEPRNLEELNDLFQASDPELERWAWEELEKAPPLKYLEHLLGERATTSELERELHSRDLAPVPSLLVVPLGMRTKPDIVVRPQNAEEVARVVKHASKHNISITPRASASTAFFNSVPVRGGILMDLNSLRGEPTLNEERGTVTVGPAIRWQELDEWLRGRGYATKSYPTSAPTATVGGWVSTGGYGIGSLKYGCVHDQVVRLQVVLTSGEIWEATRDSEPPLSWFTGSEGTMGIITQCELEVRPVPEMEVHHSIAFPDMVSLKKAALALAKGEPKPYNMHYADASYLEALEEAGFEVPAHQPLLSVDYHGDEDDVSKGAEILREVVSRTGGEPLSPEMALKEWSERFEALRAKRSGPSLLAAEIWLPLAKLDSYLASVDSLGRRLGVHFGNYGSIVSPKNVIAFSLYATNEKEVIKYTVALSLTKKLQDIGYKHGGKPYGIGLWNTPYLERIFSPDELQELRRRKREEDPKNILNPGKVYQPPRLLPPLLFNLGMDLLALVRGLWGRAEEVAGRMLGREGVDREVGAVIPSRGLSADPCEYAGLEEEALICARCGYCRSVCPVCDSVGWESSSPRGKISYAKRLYVIRETDRVPEEYVKRLYQCTLCGHCREICPTHIDTQALWLDLRRRMVETGVAPPTFERVREIIQTNYNIAGLPMEARMEWSGSLEKVPEGLVGKKGAKVLYYVGCVGAFFPLVSGVPCSLVRILERGGVDFTTLGQEERCCGFPLLAAGMEEAVAGLAVYNLQKVRELGIETLVTTCPSCYHTWKHEYERLTGEILDFEVLHSTEFLARMLESGPFPLYSEEVVTYHDPCELGRNSGIYEPPRRIVEAIPGVILTEMAQNRENALCCGGGGDLEMVDSDLVSAMAARKIQMALDTGAESIVTACPQCKRTMSAEVRAQKKRVRVLDVTEMLWRAIERGEESIHS